MHYIPLKIKTNYSLLSSLIDIDKLIKYAKENKIEVLGICDDNLCGVMDFYEACKKNNIKPIVGLDLNIGDDNILLYAKNYSGYKNLCYISSNTCSLELLKENKDDLICIVSYKSKDNYDLYSEIFSDIFISYKTKEERENIKERKCIYLNDVNAITKEESAYVKYLYMIKNAEKISDSEKYDFSDNYLEIDENKINKIDLINYKIINNLCNLKIEKQNDLLPKYSAEENFNEKVYLRKLCEKGLMKRLNNKVTKLYVDRLEYELNVINKMGFANYFLVVWDFIKYSKKNNILVGPGRGSAAGSLVSYCLGITDVNPIKYNLLFERFLNPERVTMPDIDVDFDSRKREDVINYVKEKYGKEKVANIITFGTLKSKQVLRDVSRIFDIDNDDFIKLFDSNKTLEENRKEISEINNLLKSDTLLSRIYDISLHLEGLKRHSSINAAGVVISSKNLSKYIPVYDQSGVKVTGFTINHLENLGFLKMDFLAIDNLVLLSDLKEETKIDVNKIPLNDKKTLEIFNSANTDGIFQFESSGIKNVLRKFNITSFEDLVAILALYRPGPMENIDSYILRKQGKEKIVYIHDDLKDILKDTYGIIIYQEQIMQIARLFAGFSYGEADILRRAMSKKKKDVIDSLENKFISGAIKKGYDEKTAKEIYNLIYKFANYGFNKSHSVCYALISYELAYLKANYPAFFMCHLLSMVNGNVFKTKDYILECKNNNINILKPDINRSFDFYIIEKNAIRYSLSSIKNIGTIISKQIIKEREKKEFTDFFDFVSRCYSFINKKVLANLIYAGCFDAFNYNHNTLFNNIDIAFNYAELVKDLDASFIEKPEIEIFDELKKDELIKKEFELFGFYLSNHPVQFKRKNNFTTKSIKDNFNRIISLYLLINKKREITTKKGDKMAFLEAEDEYEKIELILFPKIYEKAYIINRSNVVFVTGKVEKRYNDYQIIVNDIKII